MSTGIFQQQNFAPWGTLECRMNAACSAGLFYNQLLKLDYNNVANSPGSYAQRVQGSAFPDRYDQRFGEAVALYNRLAGTAPQPQPQPVEGFLMALSDAEQRALYNKIMGSRVSRSPLRSLGQGPVGDPIELLCNTDGSVHVLIAKMLAALGHPDMLGLLNQLANGDPAQYPDRAQDIKLAQAILAEINSENALKNGILAALGHLPAPQAVMPQESRPPAPQVVYLPAPVEPAATNEGVGEVIGELYSALEKMQLADALPITSRAPLAALISVLQTKNGSNL